jgi:hypothetical protein
MTTTMTITPEQLQELIDYLQGTCQNIATALEDIGFTEDDLAIADFMEIDQQIFLCVVCGWWCEASESDGESEEPTCQDCYDAEEE